MKKKLCGPAVYRWMVSTPNDRIYAYYVGETDDLARRVHHCLHPGSTQRTNLRLKAYFDDAVSKGQRVELQTLVFEPFQVNEVKFTMESLAHTHIRRILENLALVWMEAEIASAPILILNRVLEQEKVRTKKHLDSVLTQLKHLGLTEEQSTQAIEKLKVARA
jgi:hypothetical protein